MRPLAAHLRSPALRYRSPLIGAGGPAARVALRPATRPAEAEAPAPASRTARRRRLEAVLLLAREPLSVRRLAQLANLADGTEARTLIRELQEAYRVRRSALAVHLVAGGYRLLTRPVLAPWLGRFAAREEAPALTPPVAETLTVVAYRQPVNRAEVEAIRGAQSGEVLRQLMHRGLLRIVGRSQELGRPLLYGTTKQFLEAYGLRSLDDLPPVGPPESPDAAPPPDAAPLKAAG